MALRFNNTEITQLLYNGTEQKALKFNNIGYFGKRFSLTQNYATGVSFSISRSSSPNQRASTGSISTGNTIYYGDVITMNVTANANYANPIFYVNIGDGNGMIRRTSPFSFTVGGDVTYYGNATPINDWQTVWTGSQTFTTSGNFTVPGLDYGDKIQVTANAEFITYFVIDGNREDIYTTTSGSIYRQTLPCSIYGHTASVYLSRNGIQIKIDLEQYAEYMKGYELVEVPTLTITEVRRQS